MDETSPQWAAPSGDPQIPLEPTAAAEPTPMPMPMGDAPETSTPITSVVIEEAPKKSRKGLIAAVAIVVIAALGVGGFLLAKGGSDDESFSLEAAVARAAEAAGTESKITTEAMGQEVSITAEMGNTSKVMHMEMNLGESPLGDLSLEAIIDGPNETIYIGAEFFQQMMPDEIDAEWLKMDRAAMDAAGEDTSFFDQIDGSAQFDASAMVENAKSVTDLGMEEFEGEQVKHYEVIIATEDLAAVDGILQGQIESMDADLPDEIVYDMYVTKDNEVRRVTSAMDLGVTKVKVDIVQHLLDTEPVIEIPSGDAVVDIAEFM
jgi:hypothetical protein